jgi:mannose-6-phosphate isomerase-like protein (cupin superfamily)
LVKFHRISNMDSDSSAFGELVDYRTFFSSDSKGKHGIGDYDKDGDRYMRGYTIARFARAKLAKRENKASAQPYHSHERRDLFLIGISGKRSMIVAGKRYDIVPGTYIYIEPGEPHKTLDVGKQAWENIEIWRAQPHDDERFYEDVPAGFEPGREGGAKAGKRSPRKGSSKR